MCEKTKIYTNKLFVEILFYFFSFIWLLIVFYIIYYFDFYSDFFYKIYFLISLLFILTYCFLSINILEIKISKLSLQTTTSNLFFHLIGKNQNLVNEIDFKFIEDIKFKYHFPSNIKLSLKHIDKSIKISLVFFCKKDIESIEKEISENIYYRTLKSK